ncbi:hypothetical protein A2Z23_02665 [Candidatus Curtissbacteria bacterium RBG_16_39_7]|uniref:Uncharacterized protein n=1 Tax=Candidatus Curtissbacteria bacterium RBG_16_39_7 TaxID=1797707 RepID=A0A1F5G1L8_9BACT|nr:MAG: hypothetical protein A2Z23_02665 [Candidatus Curtissbacteria bacterium RBG_16_39_7]
MAKETQSNYDPIAERSQKHGMPRLVAAMEIVAAREMCEMALGYTPEESGDLPEKVTGIVEQINNGQEVKSEELPKKKEM